MGKPIDNPIAICAYFLWGYNRLTGKDYDGYALLVDYGRSTLNITLCDARHNGLTSALSIIKRIGSGENRAGQDYPARNVFTKRVIYLAAEASGITVRDIDSNADFHEAVFDLEEELSYRNEDVADVMSDPLNAFFREENEDVFFSAAIGEQDIDVTYGMLAKAYREVTKDSGFTEKLEEMKSYMREKEIDFSAEAKNIKIVPAGGFCDFFLTLETISNAFHRPVSGHAAYDYRFQDVLTDQGDREKAISSGADLIVNEIIDFRYKAGCSVGITGREIENHVEGFMPHYIIHIGDDLRQCERRMLDRPVLAGSVPELCVEFGDGSALSAVPKPEYQPAFAMITGYYYRIGFAFDGSGALMFFKDAYSSRDDAALEKSPISNEAFRLGEITDILSDSIITEDR